MGLSKPWPTRRLIAALSQALLFLGTLLDGVGVARADNPIVQTIYTADPAPLVYNGRVYPYTGHDEDGSTTRKSSTSTTLHTSSTTMVPSPVEAVSPGPWPSSASSITRTALSPPYK
jgi:hypothetical protein